MRLYKMYSITEIYFIISLNLQLKMIGVTSKYPIAMQIIVLPSVRIKIYKLNYLANVLKKGFKPVLNKKNLHYKKKHF